jgi:hypothetical protein
MADSSDVQKSCECANWFKMIGQYLKILFSGKGFVVIEQKHNTGRVAVFGSCPLEVEAFVFRSVDQYHLSIDLLGDRGEILDEIDEVPLGEGLLGEMVHLFFYL